MNLLYIKLCLSIYLFTGTYWVTSQAGWGGSISIASSSESVTKNGVKALHGLKRMRRVVRTHYRRFPGSQGQLQELVVEKRVVQTLIVSFSVERVGGNPLGVTVINHLGQRQTQGKQQNSPKVFYTNDLQPHKNSTKLDTTNSKRDPKELDTCSAKQE